MERARAEHYNELRDVADVYSPLALRTLLRAARGGRVAATLSPLRSRLSPGSLFAF